MLLSWNGDPTFAPATIAAAMISDTKEFIMMVMIGFLVRGIKGED